MPSLSRLRSVSALAGAAALLIACSDSTDDPTDGDTPAGSALPAETRMGTIALNVVDLETVRTYYEDGIGLDVLAEDGTEVTLGLDAEPLIRLVAHEDEQRSPTEPGLYHSAILYPDEASLADALAQLSREAAASFQGASDHRVSQAFYFADPEGNGLELYVDRPADTWEWEDGQVVMGSFALDPNAFIAEHSTAGDRPDQATMGHVHLQVGDLDDAYAFYVEAVGFAVTSRDDERGALFMSAGGYHHHLAANIWNSAGATGRSSEIGLRSLTIVLPDVEEFDATVQRIEDAGHRVDEHDDRAEVLDPWGNRLILTVGSA